MLLAREGVAREPAPEVVGFFDLLPGGKHDGLILAALGVINPEGSRGLLDGLALLRVPNHYLDVAVAVAEVLEGLLADFGPLHRRVPDLADDAALPADVRDDGVLLVELAQPRVHRLLVGAFDLPQGVAFPVRLVSDARGDFVGAGDHREDHFIRDLRPHEVAADLEQGFRPGGVLGRVQRVLPSSNQRQYVVADSLPVLMGPLPQLLRPDVRDVARDLHLRTAPGQALLRHLDSNRGGELFDGVAGVIPLHETGEGRLATLLALFGVWDVNRPNQPENPVDIVTVVCLKDFLKLDVICLQLLGLRHRPLNLQHV